MSIHVQHGEIHRIDLRTRMPFKYGIATMTTTPHVFLRLRVEVDGQMLEGVSADHLPPKWFTKDPRRAIADEVDEMLRVIEHALAAATDLRGSCAFEVWQQLYSSQAAWGRSQGLPPLLSNFGTSLVERALIECVARGLGLPFSRVLAEDRLGMRLGEIHAPLAGLRPADLLPDQPLASLTVRHTVGLADPLSDEEIPRAERVDDGLPQSLAACIRAYGLRHFKVKVNGDRDRDGARLVRIAEIIGSHAVPDYAFSLDGNEQFHAVAEFRSWWESVVHRSELSGFFEHLLFVEQPLHRDVALAPAVAEELAAWPGRPPLLIDESDGELDSLPRALELGYVGTSHKNCKGVFRGIANACLLARLQRQQPSRRLRMSGEDLANIGPVALLQDLAVCAALGIQSVERNGHHYFAGLSMFSRGIQDQVLEGHPDLYHRSRAGWPTLSIESGKIQLGSVIAAPFGVRFRLDLR